jgi:hypothetical protein
MANTKKSLRIMSSVALNGAIDVNGDAAVITLAEMGATVDGTSGLIAGSYVDNYNAGTEGVIVVDYNGVASGEEFYLTVIDVTDGREKFPRRTFTGTTITELIANSDGKEILAGDGGIIDVAADGSSTTAITVTMPLGRLFRVAANDGSAQTYDGGAGNSSVLAVLPQGFNNEQAKQYALDFIADQYGRTNRVGFPIVEPNVATALGTADYDLHVVKKVSEVKFDKNTGASYQDVEEFHFLFDESVAIASGTPIADS